MKAVETLIGTAIRFVIIGAIILLPATWCVMIGLGILHSTFDILAPLGFWSSAQVAVAIWLLSVPFAVSSSS